MEPVIFTPLADFSDADLRSAYCVGLNYTLRPGNDILAAKVVAWVEAGKVRLGTAEGTKAGDAKVSGTGTVT